MAGGIASSSTASADWAILLRSNSGDSGTSVVVGAGAVWVWVLVGMSFGVLPGTMSAGPVDQQGLLYAVVRWFVNQYCDVPCSRCRDGPAAGPLPSGGRGPSPC